MQDSPGDPDIVEQGLIDTLEELGHEPVRVDALGCGGGNSCTTGVIESVQGMIADDVDVLFPLLNVINLPAYIAELVDPGRAAGRHPVLPSVVPRPERRPRVEQGGRVQRRGRRRALQRHRDRLARRHRRVPVCPTSSPTSSRRCATASTRTRAATRTPRPTPRPTPRTARPRACARSSASSPGRSRPPARTRPARTSPPRSRGSAPIDTGLPHPGELRPGQVHRRRTSLFQKTWQLPVSTGQATVRRRRLHHSRGRTHPDPFLTAG